MKTLLVSILTTPLLQPLISLIVTMTVEYAWSQIEPATAILCACIVTYRPLFNDLHVHLPKLSNIFSYGRHNSTTDEDDWTDMSNQNSPLRWAVRRDFNRQDLDLESLNTSMKFKDPYVLRPVAVSII